MEKQRGSEPATPRRVTPGEILQLKRWNTPTIYNGWEQITRYERLENRFNRDETRDFMPQMGPMAGFAVTVVIQPSDRVFPAGHPTAWSDYRQYVASIPGPKIVVVQDLDKPDVVGAFWGEVSSSAHKALGCVGTITDGGIRDLDEMTAAGFKALARRLVVGHAYSAPIRWGCDVEVFGVTIQPGQLLHADKHGFLIIPPDEETLVLEAARFMDRVECDTKLPASWTTTGLSTDEILRRLDAADREADLLVSRELLRTDVAPM